MTRLISAIAIAFVATASLASLAFAQSSAAVVDPTSPGQTKYMGTVVSVTRTTLVIRTDEGQYRLFEQDADTTRPTQIPQRSSVAVVAKPGVDATDAPIATTVTVTAPPPSADAQGLAPQPGAEEVVPQSIRRLESDIKRQTRRYHLGFRAGSVLDPELVMFGFQGQMGPFFSDNLWARPNIEFGFGEITDLVALNFEAAYRVPITARQSRWQMYVGGGPALNFVKRGFQVIDEVNDELQEIEFDEFDLDIGLNFSIGMQSRGGFFVEMKSTAYAVPHLRFAFGYNF
jgi:hypothetical protein